MRSSSLILYHWFLDKSGDFALTRLSFLRLLYSSFISMMSAPNLSRLWCRNLVLIETIFSRAYSWIKWNASNSKQTHFPNKVLKKDYHSVMDMFKYLKPRDFVTPQVWEKGAWLSTLKNIWTENGATMRHQRWCRQIWDQSVDFWPLLHFTTCFYVFSVSD